MAVVGGGLQWVRQYRKVSDWWIGVGCFLIATGGFFVAADYSMPWQANLLNWIVSLPGGMAAAGGGTFAAAKAANSGAVPGIPKTDSKGGTP